MSSPKRPAALVTGSSRGIGKAIGLALAGNHDIVLNYRSRRDEAEHAAAAMRAAGFVDVGRTLTLGVFSEYHARKPAS